MCTALVLLLLSGENVDNININIWNYKTGGAELKYNYKPRCKIFYIWQHKSRTKHSTLNQENTGIAFLYHIEKEYFLTILTFEEIIYIHSFKKSYPCQWTKLFTCPVLKMNRCDQKAKSKWPKCIKYSW